MRKILFAIIFVCLSKTSDAQSFNWGFKGGINISKMTTEQSTPGNYIERVNYYPKTGGNFGILTRLESKKFYFQPEIQFSAKNASNYIRSTIGGDASGESTIKFKLESLQVPILIGFKLINLPCGSVNIFTGPAINFTSN